MVRNFSPLATVLGWEVSDIGNLGSARGSVDEAALGRHAVYHRHCDRSVRQLRAVQAGGQPPSVRGFILATGWQEQHYSERGAPATR